MPVSHEQENVQVSEMYQTTPSEAARELLYYVLQMGHDYCDTRHLIKKERQNGFLLCYVVKGKMCFHTTGYEKTVNAGELCFISGREGFSCMALESMEYLWIRFDGLNTRAFWEAIRKKHGYVIRPNHEERVHTRVQQLLDCIHMADSLDEAVVSCRLHDLMCSLLFTSTINEARDPQIAAAQHYLSKHLDEDLSTVKLAKEFHLSVSQFNRKFRESTGQSPHEYLVTLRINRAKTLLRDSSMSIAEIAESVGYAYDTSFAAVFRSKVGMSPRQYRNMSI